MLHPGALRLLALLALLLGCAAPQSGSPRNLILISIDTLRPDMLGTYGYGRDTSPHLDALARRGVVFEAAYATAPWTLPSHASLLTGRYPSRLGMVWLDRKLPARVGTLATLLSEAGFRTAAFVNSVFLGSRHGLDRGFQDFRLVPEEFGRRAPSLVELGAARWIQSSSGPPFFLFLHYYDVHSDYASLPEYEERFVRPYRGNVNGSTEQLKQIKREGTELSEPDLAHLEDLYVAGIQQLDDGLGRLMTVLEAADLLEDTLLAVTSDHGEEFGERGGVEHGGSQHEELVRVPLLLAGPGIPSGRRVETPVSLVDLLPTLLSRLGVAAPGGLDGHDLSPLLRGAEVPAELRDRLIFSEADGRIGEDEPVTTAVRRGRYKLIEDRSADSLRLYDLDADPGEHRDVGDLHPDVFAELTRALGVFAASHEEAERVDLGPDEKEHLRKLGYAW